MSTRTISEDNDEKLKKLWDSRDWNQINSIQLDSWSGSAFCYAMRRYKASQKSFRKVVYNGTIQACFCGHYTSSDSKGNKVQIYGSKDQLKEAACSTIYYDKSELDPVNLTGSEISTVEVINSDTLDAAKSLLDEGLKPVILNMASDLKPGGGVKSGSAAQEENISRRSDLMIVLANEGRIIKKGPECYYPLQHNSVLYSPALKVFRSNEETGYEFLSEPYTVSMISAAALRKPVLVSGHLSEDDSVLLEEKIRSVLKVASIHQHQSIVLGAWGCGAFRNPPHDVATIFKKVLSEHKGSIQKAVFAILSRAYDLEDNYSIFSKILAPDRNP
jgi:uncharacterized protein (TIGR02452 family)